MTPFPICERCGWYRPLDCTCGHRLDEVQWRRLAAGVEARHRAAVHMARVTDTFGPSATRWWDAA